MHEATDIYYTGEKKNITHKTTFTISYFLL